METRSFKRRALEKEVELGIHQEEEDEEDRISILPDDVLHQIMGFLPIKCIAQNSILSKRWNQLWQSTPDLDFTTITTTSLTRDRGPSTPPPRHNNELLMKVLSLRDRTRFDIRAFRLSSHFTFTSLNTLLRLALRRNVRELDIEVATDDYLSLPRSLVRSPTLMVLKFKSRFPGFRLPPTSIMHSGLGSLHTLSLSHVVLHDRPKLVDLFTDASFPLLRRLSLHAGFGLSCLYVGCQGLRELVVDSCSELDQLEVKASKLVGVRILNCFHVYSNTHTWFKMAAPELRSMVWERNALVGEYEIIGELSSLEEAALGFRVPPKGISEDKLWAVANLVSALSRARSLTLGSHCVEILSSKNQLEIPMSNDPFMSLGLLELHTALDRRNARGLAQLFKSCPSMHTLVLNIIDINKAEMSDQWNRELWDSAYATEGKGFWETQSQALNPFLSSLKVVKIYGLSESEYEMGLAVLLLKHGKALQEMILTGSRKRNRKVALPRDRIKSLMKGFSWASSNAKISFR